MPTPDDVATTPADGERGNLAVISLVSIIVCVGFVWIVMIPAFECGENTQNCGYYLTKNVIVIIGATMIMVIVGWIIHSCRNRE